MPDGSIDTQGVAEAQLRSIVERIENLEEEIKSLNGDKADVFAEAKGNGFDVKVLKRIIADRRKPAHEREEFESIEALYRRALGMA
jgi:uncharacterized protein (UPF0335 family)